MRFVAKARASVTAKGKPDEFISSRTKSGEEGRPVTFRDSYDNHGDRDDKDLNKLHCFCIGRSEAGLSNRRTCVEGMHTYSPLFSIG
jgi:hypothetical protein